MEIKYHRELNHNYLITQYTGDNDGYKYRMLETNKLKGFLNVSKRNINLESYLFYDITSMQSLSNIHSIRGMTAIEVKTLLKDIRAAIEIAAEYLLDESGIVFSPECIMENLTDKRYYFVYSPEENNDHTFQTFAEELLNLIDQNDDEAIQIVYNLCQLSERPGTMVSTTIDMVCAANDHEEKVDNTPTRTLGPQNKYIEETEFVEEEDSPIKEAPKEKLPKGTVTYAIVGAAFVILMAFLLYIRNNYLLTEKENIITLSIMALSFLMTVLSASAVALKVKNKETSCDEDEPEYEERIINTEQTIPRTTNSPYEKYAPQEEEYGQTVVLNGYMEHSIGRLYGKDNGKTINIDLDKLPISIGKIEGMVDIKLSDASISRIHARITAGRDEEVILEDMNSTNGTFLNGIRLKPQEKVVIQPGDEIRLGQIRFDYR
jgi:hypothetical protein